MSEGGGFTGSINGAPRRERVERGIYRQPNGNYAVCVMVDGQPRFHAVKAATLAEARRQRELLRTLARLGELPASPRLTFAEVAGRWLAEFEVKVAVGERRARTLDLYCSQLRRHLLPRLGRRRLALLAPDDVVDLTRDLQAEGLAPWTIKGVLGVLSCVFGYAHRRGLIASHPFERLERDERPHPLGSEQRVLSQSELARLLAACPQRYRPLLATATYTGLRLSELLALSLDDVDFAAGVIHVRHQLARGRRGISPHRVPPKTRASLREIPLLPQLAAVLREHKRGSPFTAGSDYVFATTHGTAFLHHNVSKRVLRRAAADAEQPHPRPRAHQHDPRHLHTHLFEQAAHGADVRARLARSDFANLLTRALEPRLVAGGHLRSTRPAAPRRLPSVAAKRRRCTLRSLTGQRCRRPGSKHAAAAFPARRVGGELPRWRGSAHRSDSAPRRPRGLPEVA